MPFTCIHGTYRLTGKNKTGNVTGFQPDGDSIQFQPKKITLLNGLMRLGVTYKPSLVGSVNLRMEGIDALELHYTPSFKGAKRTNQPHPDAAQARDKLTGFLGMNPVSYAQPVDLTVLPTTPIPTMAGYILSRSLDVHGRPVSFLFSGAAPFQDGSQVRLTAPMLRRSLNHAMLIAGQAYPLFYDTLFKDLRDEFAKIAVAAQAANKGVWKNDSSRTGFKSAGLADLENQFVIFPKLFRRLADYFESGHATLAGFIAWQKAISTADPAADQVLDENGNFTHLDNLLKFKSGKLSMPVKFERLVFISSKK